MDISNVFNESALKKNPEGVISEIAKFSEWILAINNLKQVPATFIFNPKIKKKIDPIINFWVKLEPQIKEQKKLLKEVAREIDILLSDKETQLEISRIRKRIRS